MRRIFLFCLLTFGASAAIASPLTWTLVGVTFDDGGSASGSFVFDADTNVFSSVNVTTTTGTTRAGAVYNAVSWGFPANDAEVLFVTHPSGDLTGTPGFAVFFDPPFLSNAGGTVPLFLGSQEADCADASCSSPTGATRSILSGEVDTPEPASVLLMGFGAVALVSTRAFRKSR